MHRTRTARPARLRLAIAGTSTVLALSALALSLSSAGARGAPLLFSSAGAHGAPALSFAGARGAPPLFSSAGAHGAPALSFAGAHGAPPLSSSAGAHGAPVAATASAARVTVRVEGPHSTLVPTTTVQLHSGTITKDGVAADGCSERSAAGALELATHGRWTGTWSKSLKGYFVSAIDGVAFPATGAEYWAFWIGDAPASQGICGVDPKSGASILFFPDCYGKSCPKQAGVLGIAAPRVSHAGRPFTVTVTAYADASGKPSPAVGATVRGGGANARTGAGGAAQLTVTRGGLVTLRATMAHAIRTEAKVCVESATVTGCA
jgi:hypothetical protein